jgi:cytochrome c
MAVTGFADIVLQMEGDPEYGEYLAGECVTCHQASGHADGIPSIVGLPKDYFVTSLFEYLNNVRSNDVMKLRVANLSNEEIAALAAYFSSLEPQ